MVSRKCKQAGYYISHMKDPSCEFRYLLNSKCFYIWASFPIILLRSHLFFLTRRLKADSCIMAILVQLMDISVPQKLCMVAVICEKCIGHGEPQGISTLWPVASRTRGAPKWNITIKKYPCFLPDNQNMNISCRPYHSFFWDMREIHCETL